MKHVKIFCKSIRSKFFTELSEFFFFLIIFSSNYEKVILVWKTLCFSTRVGNRFLESIRKYKYKKYNSWDFR